MITASIFAAWEGGDWAASGTARFGTRTKMTMAAARAMPPIQELVTLMMPSERLQPSNFPRLFGTHCMPKIVVLLQAQPEISAHPGYSSQP